jgi:hypothetical protein
MAKVVKVEGMVVEVLVVERRLDGEDGCSGSSERED